VATHDYVISNGTGSAVRSDINAALAAIVSQNSNASEPATMYAYQWWADTTTGLLKIRNAANSAWVTIGTLASANLGLLPLAGGTMTGVLAVTAGTAALPGIAVSGDTNTGIYSPGADQIGIATGGTARINIDSSGRLLVGTATTADFGSVIQTAQTTGVGAFEAFQFSNNTAYPFITFAKSRGATAGTNTIVQNGDSLGEIVFRGADGTDYDTAASITAYVDGEPGTAGDATDMPGRLVFSTTADGAASPTQRMIISSNGAAGFFNLPYIYPNTDNAASVGLNGNRWSAIWAANGTIQTSDQRAKKDITNSQLGSDFIKSLRPVSYKWIEGGKVDSGERDEDGNYIYESVPGTRTHWGFIAQEIKEAVDAAGVDFGGWVLTEKDDPDSQQALRYDQFIAPLTKALQEALIKIEALEADVAALKGA